MAASDISRRRTLDALFCLDAALSVVSGLLLTFTPHRFLLLATVTSATTYSHPTHEALRLYGCLRLAVGWILLKIRHVDDGRFRRGVTEALCFSYVLQSLVVLRAQLTADSGGWINWLAFLFLAGIAAGYGTFRFGKGGRLIKVYELPTSGGRAQR